MALSRLLPLLGACLILLANFLTVAGANDPTPDDPVDRHIAVQKVILLGTHYLLEDDPAKAVEVLEKKLYLIDGNKAYLLLLRDAYKAHILNLYLTDQSVLAEKYLNRLRILDPYSADLLTKTPSASLTKAASANPGMPATPPSPLPGKKASPVPGKAAPQPIVRASMADEFTDPFSLTFAHDIGISSAVDKISLAQSLLNNAEIKFNQEKYQEARQLFEQAYQADAQVLHTNGTTDRWAYCKFKYVVDQLNDGASSKSLAELENEVKSALALKPNPKINEHGLKLLQQIAQQRESQARAIAAVQVQHYPKNAKGWLVAETAYFRIHHNQSKEYAEQIANIAENTRAQMTHKWFGAAAQKWRNRCEIYLHATGKEYSQKTGVPSQSPGHSRIESDSNSGEVIVRQIELRCDNPDLLPAVLPHEITHVVLAGQFGSHQVPRWVDEGVAVLAEPAHKVNLHLNNLSSHQGKQELFHVRELIELKDYPHPSRIGAFYAQSVSLVEFLTAQANPRVFSQFVLDGLSRGYETSLRQHYKIQNYSELQSRWMQHVLAGLNQNTGYAQK